MSAASPRGNSSLVTSAPTASTISAESDAEESDDDGEHLVSRGDGVEDRGLHSSRAGRRDEVDVVLGHENSSEVVAHAFEHVSIFRPSVVDHLPRGDLQDLFR